MTKRSKKNVKDIRSALLSKTGFLNQTDNSLLKDEDTQNNSIIEPDLLEKLEALAEFEKTDTKTMVNKALNHFLRLKGLQVELALKAKSENS